MILCRWCKSDHYRPTEQGEVRCWRCGEPEDRARPTTGTLPPCPLDRPVFGEWEAVEPEPAAIRTIDVPIYCFTLAPPLSDHTRLVRVAAMNPDEAFLLARTYGRDAALDPRTGRVVDLIAGRTATVMRFVLEDFVPRLRVRPGPRASDEAIGRSGQVSAILEAAKEGS